LENLGVDLKMILKWILNKTVLGVGERVGGRGLNLSGSEPRQMAGCFERVINLRVPENAGKILEWLRSQ
jgi:hypothetical protein